MIREHPTEILKMMLQNLFLGFVVISCASWLSGCVSSQITQRARNDMTLSEFEQVSADAGYKKWRYAEYKGYKLVGWNRFGMMPAVGIFGPNDRMVKYIEKGNGNYFYKKNVKSALVKFVNSLPKDGQSTLTFTSGEEYVGNWKDAKRNGQGSNTWPNGQKYVGEFKDDIRNGQGTLTLPSGEEYVGTWKGDKRNGQGTNTWPNGQKYVGEFKDDKKDGQGTLTLPSGEEYVGTWKGGKRNGQGTLTLPSGEKYVGTWKGDKRNGQGTNAWPSGEKYVGTWKGDKAIGQGTLTWPDGTNYTGTFKDGEFNGQGTITWSDGSKYTGMFKGYERHDEGRLVSSDGNRHAGSLCFGGFIRKVLKFSQEDRIGLLEGDTILEYNDIPIVNGANSLINLASSTQPRDQIELKAMRNGVEKRFELNGGKMGLTITSIPRFEINREVTTEQNYIYTAKQPKLFVETDLQDASIKILNITPKFHQGIELNPGKYHVEISAEGYKKKNIWVDLSSGEKKLYVSLSKIIESPFTTSEKKASYSLPSQRWAVIIGVSNYIDSQIPSLRYADRDAKKFHEWLISPNGGRYAPSRVKLLINREASLKNIKNSFFVWLRQALEEDVVTIFFAGHGSPESPDSQGNLFLLPYDTDYQNVATSAFPMWDIETALKRYIKAKKVVIIADACHSGGVGQPFNISRRANRGIKVNKINTGLQDLSNIGNGVCVISASGDKQYSQENKDWGGGHGVFTYFLLKGLKGDADYDNDNRVSLGELTPYLSQQVRRATQSAQSPVVAGKYDPALSIGR